MSQWVTPPRVQRHPKEEWELCSDGACDGAHDVKDEEFDQDTDDDETSHGIDPHPESPVKQEQSHHSCKSEACAVAIKSEEGECRSQRKRAIDVPFLECCKCLSLKRRDKFSTKQWKRGIHGCRTIYCRRCEEKRAIRHQVGHALERLCVRIHTKKNRRSEAKFLCTVIPENTKQSFLPPEITLDGYTREAWSMGDNEFNSLWQSTTLRCLVGDEKMDGFLSFLRERKKSAYGTFALSDGTDGFFFVPFYQLRQKMEGSPCKRGTSSTRMVCKYILGLGLNNAGPPTDEIRTPAKDPEEEQTEDYLSTSVLQSLLAAQRRTEASLAIVPEGSVKAAPKLQSKPSRPKPKNAWYFRDWYGPQTIVSDAGDK